MDDKRFEIQENALECNPYVYCAIADGAACLDVGCSDGKLGAALIQYKNCTVDGLDYSDEALQVARQRGYRETIRIDLNRDKFITDKKYDFIIFSDVLEHLLHPQEVLCDFKPLLKRGGSVVISVPNSAFIQQRIFLLCGKFDYNPHGGLMDVTHRRFFTAKTIKKLCADSGLGIKSFEGYNLVKKRFWFLKILGPMFPGLFSLQFLIMAHTIEDAECRK